MRFLSPEWLAQLASSISVTRPDICLSIHQRVTGGPGGDIEYTLRFEHCVVSATPGPGSADVEMVQDYQTAVAISQGRLSPSAAFGAGLLRLGGSIGLLVEHRDVLALVGGGMTELAEATTY